MKPVHLLTSVTLSVLFTLDIIAGLYAANKTLSKSAPSTQSYYLVTPHAVVATTSAGFAKEKAALLPTPTITLTPSPTLAPRRVLPLRK